MSISVETMARIGSYVMAEKTLGYFIKGQNIAPEDVAEVTEIWNSTETSYKNMKPGEQMMLPGEWG